MAFDDSVAMIGNSYNNFPQLEFLSDSNLYEFGTLIVDPNAVYSELVRTGGPPFRSHAHYWFTRRSQQLDTWVSEGHSLILLVTSPISWLFEFVEDSLPASYQLSLYEMLSLSELQFHRATGNRIDYVGPANAETILRPHINHMQYQAIITGSMVQPLLQVRRRTAGERQLVGCAHTFNKGRVVCVPFIDGDANQNAAYRKALAELPTALSARGVPLPEWVDSFRTEQELLSMQGIEKLGEEVRERRALIAQHESVIGHFRELKALFAGSGEEFKNAVKEALQELGLQCLDGPHPRADLLASDGRRLMAVEAKGLDGPARERNFRQVQSWKAEVDLTLSVDAHEANDNPDLKRYADQLKQLGITTKPNEDCKGLMAIGTFKSTPLSDRSLPDFPDNVSRLLVSSNVCGITGLQLFGLILLARSDSTLKEKIVASLFGTSGVLNMAPDWREFLKQIP